MALVSINLAASAATITVINDDPPGVGLNDTTSRNPVGGNPGQTLGEQRLFAFEFAAGLLGNKIASDVEILVEASLGPLACNSNSATLGRAGPRISVADFGSGQPDTFYAIALANALAGEDLQPAGTTPETDIGAEFNGNIDNNNNCLQGISWYYGVDGNAPSNTVDFPASVTHELIHGLGFVSFVNTTTGSFPSDIPTAFDRFVFDLDVGQFWPALTNAERLESVTNDGDVVFDGPLTTTNGAPSLTNGVNDGRVQIFAPSPVQGGSSIAHWDSDLLPNALMEPADTGDIDINDGIGLAACLLSDIGWNLIGNTNCPDISNSNALPVLTVSPSPVDFGIVETGMTELATVTISNGGTASLTITNIVAPGDPFAITAQECSEGGTITPGEACDITVEFSPTSTGSFSDSLNIASDGGNESIALTGDSTPEQAPVIVIDPASVEFGSITTGDSAQQSVTVRNSGNADLILGALSTPSTPFTKLASGDNCSNNTLEPAAQCMFILRFAPPRAGNFSGRITVASNDGDIAVPLSGSGQSSAMPAIEVTPAAIDFGNIGVGSNDSRGIDVRNAGSAALQISTIDTPTAPFAVTQQNCVDRTLAPGGNCRVTVRFTPTTTGNAMQSLGIVSDDAVNPNVVVSLAGNGVIDSDADGVADTIEDNAPNDGDGNDDGIPDSNQATVTSLPGARDDYVTLETDAGVFANVRAEEAPSRVELPDNITFDNGFFAFDITGLTPGASATVILLLPRPANAYYKYPADDMGSTPAVRFDFDETSNTGARVDANRVLLHLRDGGRGDADVAVNGVITDPGGPGFNIEKEDDAAGSGGGGGCTMGPSSRQRFDPTFLVLLLLATTLLGMRRSHLSV
ncbi:choice-of-anchor D domain-containing protein [Salinisphaera sp. P385]|uniref:Choice-of-anchor D domain-containing protein n=1 Tax=Spectribacter acetivorans TaxID=3075603 RepID=A0ABU3BAS7_9GAMM|nr:choice-of-anchor D domain-containing protein [Salinisphaera sp. P385]MDT0619379.1 choice-of-anchor D domain-containing protein [Salinisphaera sp. P385]